MSQDSTIKTVKLKEILARLMLERGLSANALAGHLSVAGHSTTTSTIAKILSGKIMTPRLSTVKALADYFGVSTKYLMYGDEGAETESDITTLKKEVANIKNLLAEKSKTPIDEGRAIYLIEKYIHEGLVVFRTNGFNRDEIVEILDRLDRGLREKERHKRETDSEPGENSP